MRSASILVLAVAGCFEAHPPEGYFLCATTDPRCPRGYHCAADDTCRTSDSDSDGGSSDAGSSDGGSDGGKLSGLTLLAGGVGGPGTANGPGVGARFGSPAHIAFDGAGHLYLTDTASRTVRSVDVASGTVATLAGDPDALADQIDDTGKNAHFMNPYGIAWAAGVLYVTDGQALRKVTVGGVVTTEPVTLMLPRGLAWDSGVLYLAEGFAVSRWSPGALQTTVVAGTPTMPYPMGSFAMPDGVAFHQGALYVTDRALSVVQKVVLPNGPAGVAAGAIMMHDFADGTNARFRFVSGIASDGSLLYLADTGNQLLRSLDPTNGMVSTLCGQVMASGDGDGLPAQARLNGPRGVAATGGGTVFVGDGGNHALRKYDGQMVTTVAGQALHDGYADERGAAARFRAPTGVAADGAGYLYVSDTSNQVLRRIDESGLVTLEAGAVGIDGMNDAVGADARLSQPLGLACDGTTLYVAESTGLIRTVDLSSRLVGTLAGGGTGVDPNGMGRQARFNGPVALALDGGHLYVAEYGNAIRDITLANQMVITLAGDPVAGWVDDIGTAARFSVPSGIAADGQGNLYVSDGGNHVIRQIVIATRQVTTWAGVGTSPGADDGALLQAHFRSPTAVMVESPGVLLVADGNHTVRRLANGQVTTPVGVAGESGIGLGPLPGRLHSPAGLAPFAGGVAVTSLAENAVLVIRW